jgi:hypothetical protein
MILTRWLPLSSPPKEKKKKIPSLENSHQISQKALQDIEKGRDT